MDDVLASGSGYVLGRCEDGKGYHFGSKIQGSRPPNHHKPSMMRTKIMIPVAQSVPVSCLSDICLINESYQYSSSYPPRYATAHTT